MRKRSGLETLCLLVAGACGGSSDRNANADTLTQRQRDSIVAASKLPGAKAVGAALRASDAAAARAATLDSINR